MTRWRQILAAVALAGPVALGAGLVAPITAQADRSFGLASLDTEAVVAADGTMAVTETVTYRFSVGDGDRPYTKATRTFDTPEQIRGLRVSEAGLNLPVTQDGRVFGWTYPPQATGERTFVLTYGVTGALRPAPDVAEVVWKFIGTDHPGVGRMRVTVRLPAPSPPAPEGDLSRTDVLRAFAHGPRNGTVELLADGARFQVAPVPASTFVEAVVVAPRATFTGVEPTGTPQLARILERERGFLDDRDSEDAKRTIGTWLGPVGAVGGILSVLALWWKRGREPEVPDIGEYWREPLTDPPAVVYATVHHGTVTATALSATALDLAQRGWMKVTATKEERLGPDKNGFAFERTPQGKDQLSRIDLSALGLLFPDGSTTSTTESVQAWAKANRSTGEERWKGFQAAVRDEYEAKGYHVTGRPKLWLAYAGILVGLIGLTVAAGLLRSLVGAVIGGVGVLVVAGLGPLLRQRTPLGARRATEAKALTNYLKDFSQLDEAPVGHIVLWERFLVYAVALGVAGELARGLSSRLPSLVADPGFAPWYVPLPGGTITDSLPGFDHDVGAPTVAAMQPPSSSSGSGGGFSGGDAGGGGGGGFGAD